MGDWSERRVEGCGPLPARIMLVGEAPGENEDKLGMPFVGMGGKVLDSILQEVGLRREELYITNIAKNRPTNNVFEHFTEEYLAQAKAELEEEMARANANVIVALGENALRIITGFAGITKWRGSVLAVRGRKVIPTIHPAAVLREWSFRPAVVADFKRIKAESADSQVRKLERSIRVVSDRGELCEILRRIREEKPRVAFDIEVETSQITCIGMAVSAVVAVCVPFWFGSSGSFWSEEDEVWVWGELKGLLEDETIPKVAQNAQYDMTILERLYGIKVKGLVVDTMIAFHCLYPELPKNLGFLTSIYTDVAYYKFLRKTDDMMKFFEYNAMDALVTWECAGKIEEELRHDGLWEFYVEHMHSLIEPLMAMARIGVRVDSARKKKVVKVYRRGVDRLQRLLDRMVGHALNVNSPKQMKLWLYEEKGFKVREKLRKGKTDKTVSADEEALLSIYNETGDGVLKVVLALREKRKILSTYLEVTYDKEEGEGGEVVERARTSYLITGTETGRLSSRATAYGTGSNLQNIPKGVARRLFIPDDGQVFINADLSQAEARVVAFLAGEDRLIRVFNEGGDIHRKNAANIFHKRVEDVTGKERELAKRVVHGANYGIGPVTFAKNVGVSVAEAKKLLNQFFAEYPKIKLWQMKVAKKLKATRVLVTPFGRRRIFFNGWSESLVKEGYAYVPQSTIADLLNMGLRRLHEKIKAKRMEGEILLQIHDAVLLQARREVSEAVAREVRETLTIPLFIEGKELIVPVDVSIGENWNDLVKVAV